MWNPVIFTTSQDSIDYLVPSYCDKTNNDMEGGIVALYFLSIQSKHFEACGHSESADINMLQLLLYGNKYLPLEANKLILNLTIKYISETERFG